MRRIQSASVSTRSRPFYLFGVTALSLGLTAAACGKTEDGSSAGGSGGMSALGGSPSDHPAGGSGGSAGNASIAGAPSSEAGVGGDAGASAGEAGAAGAPPDTVTCQPGGILFVVGNYSNAAGDELLLRSTVSASTLAFVSKGPATPAKPPQLFSVERACAPGGALIVRDATSEYRVDFSQSGGQIALCASSPVATLDAAYKLPAADLTHINDTGCAGRPFGVYTAEAL